MTKINKIILHIFLLFFLYSCGAFSDAGKVLRNEKIRSTDEFLIKKREPLSLPPDYKTLPEPGSLKTSKEKDEKKINEILKISKDKNTTKQKSTSVEQSIINQLGK